MAIRFEGMQIEADQVMRRATRRAVWGDGQWLVCHDTIGHLPYIYHRPRLELTEEELAELQELVR